MTERKNALRICDTLSVIYQHIRTRNCGIDWDGFTVLVRYSTSQQRNILEAYHLEQQLSRPYNNQQKLLKFQSILDTLVLVIHDFFLFLLVSIL